jgi:hypothetical protein
MMSVVDELVLPSASVAVTMRVLVELAVRLTIALQLPALDVVALVEVAPPIMEMVVPVAAVPKMVIGEVLVEWGEVGKRMIGTLGAVEVAVGGVVVPALEACVTTKLVEELVLPAASMAVTMRVLVLEAVRSTEALQSPALVVLAVEVAEPPIIMMLESPSAVPPIMMGLVEVERGPIGKTMTGALGAVVSGVGGVTASSSSTVKEKELGNAVSVDSSTRARVMV